MGVSSDPCVMFIDRTEVYTAGRRALIEERQKREPSRLERCLTPMGTVPISSIYGFSYPDQPEKEDLTPSNSNQAPKRGTVVVEAESKIETTPSWPSSLPSSWPSSLPARRATTKPSQTSFGDQQTAARPPLPSQTATRPPLPPPSRAPQPPPRARPPPPPPPRRTAPAPTGSGPSPAASLLNKESRQPSPESQ